MPNRSVLAVRRDRSRKALWQATFRRRQREHARLVEVSANVVTLLLEANWLRDSESKDAAAISRALDRMAKASLAAEKKK
jgi:hypothetical protein